MPGSTDGRSAMEIARRLGFLRARFLALVGSLLALSAIGALLEGVGVVVLLKIVTRSVSPSEPDAVTQALYAVADAFGSALGAGALVAIVGVVFAVRALVAFGVTSLDAYVVMRIRRRIQEAGLRAVVHGDWEAVRDARVGQQAGALTEESWTVAKYLMSAVRAAQYALTVAVLAGVAALVSPGITLLLVLAALPVVGLLQLVFAYQGRLSREQAVARQAFAADAVERLSNLFEIKANGRAEVQFRTGVRAQEPLSRIEVKLGYAQASATSLLILLPVLLLAVVYLWTAGRGVAFADALPAIAQVLGVGARAASQANAAIGAWGQLSRLSGSLPPVLALLSIPPEPSRAPIDEAIARVEMRDVRYAFPGGPELKGLRLSAARGSPLVLRGPSGSGKTTIANLVAGLYRPHGGDVVYVGESGRTYKSSEHRPRIGYATQDVYLFHGTVRANVDPTLTLPTPAIEKALERAGAAAFVRQMGGLDAPIAEAGRSLSGGQKRRLGIARALALDPALVVFDEITAGLDDENKQRVRETVLETARSRVVVVITHEDHFDDAGAIHRLEGSMLAVGGVA